MPPPEPNQITLDGLTDCVREAGALALSHFGNNPRSDRKADGTSVSEADLAVDRLLKDRLLKLLPESAWLSEESTDDGARLEKSCTWIVDPIDGTRAFLNERPEWTICVALVEAGQPVIASVFNPAKDEFFHAVRDGGAFLNGARLQVKDPVRLEDATLAAGSNVFRGEPWAEAWPTINTVWFNSIAYRMVLVAAGICDGTVSLSGKNDWDIAAADLILSEAGGQCTRHDGRAFTYNKANTRHPSVVCAGQTLHAELIAGTSQATI